MTVGDPDSPSYLSKWMAPVADEIEAVDLPVKGTLPPELSGLYLRNGPNPPPGVDPGHNFTGQGMIHGVRLGGGKALWYRNRWVDTPSMHGAHPINPDGTRNLTASVANTSVLLYNRAILALVEYALPFAITPDLDTIGPYDFDGKLNTPMTAHPKRDPATGKLHFFGYDFRPPFVTYHIASPDGRLLHSEPIKVTGSTMMHDFGITENYAIWLDLPVVFNREAAAKGMPFHWSANYPARIGLTPLAGGDVSTRWVNVAPGYAFHVANAYEDAAGRVVIDAARYDEAAFDATWEPLGGRPDDAGEHPHSISSGCTMYRWLIDPEHGLISEEPLDELQVEFPTTNRTLTGRPNRYTYAVTLPRTVETVGGKIVKYDRSTGQRGIHDLTEGWIPGEALFVPARGALSEDDGWLLTISTHASADAAQLLVQDASKVSAPALAVIHLPRRVPSGFHGAWIPDGEV